MSVSPSPRCGRGLPRSARSLASTALPPPAQSPPAAGPPCPRRGAAGGCPTRRPPRGGFWRQPTVTRHCTWRWPGGCQARLGVPAHKRGGVASTWIGSGGAAVRWWWWRWRLGLLGTAVSFFLCPSFHQHLVVPLHGSSCHAARGVCPPCAPRAASRRPATRIGEVAQRWLADGWRAGEGGGGGEAEREPSDVCAAEGVRPPTGPCAGVAPLVTASHHRRPPPDRRACASAVGRTSGGDPRWLVHTGPHPQPGLCFPQCQRDLWHARTAPRSVPPCPNGPTPPCIWEMAAESRAPSRRRYPVRASPDSVRGAELPRRRQTPQPSTLVGTAAVQRSRGHPPSNSAGRVSNLEQPSRGCPYHKAVAWLVVVRGTVPRRARLPPYGSDTTRWRPLQWTSSAEKASGDDRANEGARLPNGVRATERGVAARRPATGSRCFELLPLDAC